MVGLAARTRVLAGMWLAAAAAASFAQEASEQPPLPAALAAQQQLVFQRALRTITPCIVRIDTIGGAQPVKPASGTLQLQPAGPTFRQADGPTTGLIWSSDGYILTSSFNFVRDPVVITVTLSDGRGYVARLVARDRLARLALLKIEARDLSTPQWVSCDRLRVGQWALAAGWGHGGDEPALSAGIVSALGRMSGLAIQTDAKISPANYGGPLFDIEGRVIGVCVPMGPGEDELAGVEWYDSGIGFAIHRDRAQRSVARLQQGQELQRGLIGVYFDMHEPVVGVQPTAAQADESADGAGLRIIGAPRGPAAAAGLKADDVITHVDGEPTPRVVDFRRVLASKAAGDTLDITYRRGDQSAVVTLTLAAAEDFRSPPTSQPK
jgi:serine protease Do